METKSVKSYGLLGLFLVISVLAVGAGGTLQFTLEENDGEILLSRGEEVVLQYNKERRYPPEGMDPIYARNGHIHPLRAPGGPVLTDEFPVDHAHQSGLFNAWTNTLFDGREVDFWNLHKGLGYVEHRRVIALNQDERIPSFTVELAHVDKTTGTDIDALYERWRVQLVESADDLIIFDITSTQRCAGSIPLEVQKHRYGGMAIRTSGGWSKNFGNASLEVLNSEGQDRLAGDQQPASWVRFSGQIDGDTTSVAVLCHPGNFRAPQVARIHPDMPYFVWSPGNREGFTIHPGMPFVSRYRYILTRGRVPSVDELNQRFAEFGSPMASPANGR